MPPMGAADGAMPGCVPPHTGQPKPAGPGGKPAAPSDKDTAKAGLARASREVAKHAGVLARDAIEQAARATRDAATQASDALRRAFAPASDAQAAERAAKAAARAERRRRRHRRGVLVVAAVLVGMFLIRTMVRSTSPRPSWPGNASVMAVQAFADQADAVAATWSEATRQLVASHASQWVALATREPEQAHTLLLARIERLRAQVPLAPEQRATVAGWPEFVDIVPVGETERLQPQLARLVANRDYDKGLAQRLAARAPASLVLASRMLQEVAWDTEEAQRAGARLHRFLSETTGCQDLELVDPDTCEPEVARRQNRPLGKLWRWFVDEFARDEPTWRAYRQLLDR
jgi:hypothetical protein